MKMESDVPVTVFSGPVNSELLAELEPNILIKLLGRIFEKMLMIMMLRMSKIF